MTDPSPADRAWVEVDLAALVANARLVASRAQRPLLPMVKANGYGLGAVAVAEALLEIGPWGFGVATPDEARELRTAGITKPIVCFTPLVPAWIPILRALDVRPAIGDAAMLAAWQQAGGGPYHLELDSGMARGGIRWDDGAGWAAALLAAGTDDDCEGLFSHCHSAETDAASVAQQAARLAEVAAAFPRRPTFVHLANSAVALSHAAYAGDLARPGIALYGSGAYGEGGAIRPAPVARLAARVVAVRLVRAGDTVSYGAAWTARRETRIATLAIGYADGIPRSLSNRGLVELAGRVVPVVGRVTMDMTLVAVPDDVPVAPGDVATLFGHRITLDAQALAAGTIGYELLTALGSRVRRLYR